MSNDAVQRMQALISGSAGLVLEVFLEARIEEKLRGFMSTSDGTFQQHKGRIAELQELVQFIQKGRK